MIVSFKSKHLAELWETGTTRKLDARMHDRIMARLDALDVALLPADMHIPGFNFHPLKGFDPVRYSVHVNGPWCVTFELINGEARAVDFEQYH